MGHAVWRQRKRDKAEIVWTYVEGGIVDILDRGCRRCSSPVDMERVGVTGRCKG